MARSDAYGLGYTITRNAVSKLSAEEIRAEHDAWFVLMSRERDRQAAYALDPSLRPRPSVYEWRDPADLFD